MSQVLDIFVEWFNQLTPSQKIEIARYACDRQKRDSHRDKIPAKGATSRKRSQRLRMALSRKSQTANFDGYYAGPAPGQRSNYCPSCGKPL
jgi:hypothetical protein